MNIQYLIDVATNKIKSLEFEKDCAYQSWDLEKLNEIDREIAQTNDTIKKLNSLI